MTDGREWIVYWFGITEYHDVKIYKDVPKSKILAKVKKDAAKIGANGFMLLISHNGEEKPVSRWIRRPHTYWKKEWG